MIFLPIVWIKYLQCFESGERPVYFVYYKCCSAVYLGTSTIIRVPSPGLDLITRLPPISRVCSCIPVRPSFPVLARSPIILGISDPLPLSEIDTTVLPLLKSIFTSAFVASEWRYTFRSASCVMRNNTSSTFSDSRRGSPCILRLVEILEYVSQSVTSYCIAGNSPRWSSIGGRRS